MTATTMTAGPLPRRVELALVAALLLFFVITGWLSAAQMSLTADEAAHIPAGLALLQQRDTRLNPEHPPLMKLAAAAPLALAGYRADYGSPLFRGTKRPYEFAFADQFLVSLGPGNIQHPLMLARAPMLLLSAFGGLLVWLCGRRLFGPLAGVTALLLYATAPFYLGYFPLVTNDSWVAIFTLASVLAFASMVSRPGWFAVAIFGLALGCALLSKFSALALLPALLFARVALPRTNADARRPRFPFLSGCAIAFVLVVIVYWAACNNTWAPSLLRVRMVQPVYSDTLPKAALIGQRYAAWLTAHPHTASFTNPANLYLTGVLSLFVDFGRPAFLLGKIYPHGTWAYFPVLYALKASIATQLASLLLVIFLIWNFKEGTTGRLRALLSRDLPLLTAVLCAEAVFILGGFASSLQIGLRHMSPALLLSLPLICGFVPLMEAFAGERHTRTACGALAAMAIFTAVSSYPEYIPYFNALRGPVPKQMIASDSNVDWGQQLIEIEHYRASHGIVDPLVLTLEFYPPDLYVTGAQKAPSFDCRFPGPLAGKWIFLGADELAIDPTCGYLAPYRQDVIANGSVFVYHLPQASSSR